LTGFIGALTVTGRATDPDLAAVFDEEVEPRKSGKILRTKILKQKMR